MRTFSKMVALSLGLTIFSGTLLAQRDSAPVNIDAILRDLDQLEKNREKSIFSIQSAAISRLRSVVANPSAAFDLYEKAVKDIQFEGRSGQGMAFIDWKKSKQPGFRTVEAKTAMTLHLKYLILSLQRGASDEPEKFVQPSLAYVAEVAAADEMFLQQRAVGKGRSVKNRDQMAAQSEARRIKSELLDKPLRSSLFVRWMRLENYLPKAESWELTPGNISGLLDKNIRPAMREAKDPKLIDTWAFEIKVLADRVTFGQLEHRANEFNTITRPKFQFARANDMEAVGQKNRAINEIYSMVKTYPQHPDFETWVSHLRTLLKSASSPPESTPAESPAETPTE